MLEVKNLTKKFGVMTAVNHISFNVEQGKILGLIGQNGAGKTTTFRIILSFLTANSGEVLWNGHILTKNDYDSIGYLPEERGLYLKESVQQQLIYFARLKGKSRKEILPRIDYWMRRFKVKGKKMDKVSSLSKGNQQKIQLIATLIHEPKLLILDEPFSGLDPVNSELLKKGIIEMKEKGTCIIFSSHNMDNVEKICDNILMLRNGSNVLNGKIKDIRASFGRTKLLLDSHLTEKEIISLNGVDSVHSNEDGIMEIKLTDPNVGKKIFEMATQDGYIPTFSQQSPTLEEIFKLKVGEGNE